MRVYLDFTLDESYTPTRMEFYAGMGGNDLIEFAVWQGTSPRGWVDINLVGVGGNQRKPQGHKKRKARGAEKIDEADEQSSRRRKTGHSEGGRRDATVEEDEQTDESRSQTSSDDSDHMDISDSSDDDSMCDELDYTSGNVLKAMVVQMRIVGNHQNGKDSHVRGFQVFARDDRRAANAPAEKIDQKATKEDDAENETDVRQRPSVFERYLMPEPEIR